ncbi:MAG: UDP-N-acetylmuramoyl-L-alanine--D-glutamate ligase [Acidobacteriota bacterium]|jgi:UDP-N-acetylmuramoylalanine--D-glutamate ligase|nr:UDP-N-acetylmuramoyl-L-alanine--D-glutamate ligase [Acidobacteriota bacterium]
MAMTDADYLGRSALVAGAARSGIAAARFLLGRGARVILSDAKGREALAPEVSALSEFAAQSPGELVLELGGNRDGSFAAVDFVVASPGMPLTLPCFEASRRAGVPVIAEVELAWRHLKGAVVGVTGSTGKTTTTMLATALAAGAGRRAFAAGNIGAPLIDFVERSEQGDVYVVELSSFQLEAIVDFKPLAAAVLNLTPDHMDRYPGFGDYVAAKARILMNQRPGDVAVLNADDPLAAALAGDACGKVWFFSRTREVAMGAFVRDGMVVFRDGRGERGLFPADAMRLRGGHNLENVLAASLLALAAGAPPESLEAGVRGFRGVEHRIEPVAEIGGVAYYNDSKATNVDATAKALEAFPGGVHLIAGGRDKAGDFTALRPLVQGRVKQLVLVGEAAGKLRAALAGATEIRDASSMREAVAIARAGAVAGDVVLLAPACASFDMFDDYEHRGRVFKDAVRALEA